MSEHTTKDVVLVVADTPTRHGVVYPVETLQAAVKRGTLYGELAPDRREDESALALLLNEVAVQVGDLRVTDGALLGTVTLLDTPNGKALAEALVANQCTANDITWGIRGRGRRDGDRVILETITAIDAVALKGRRLSR